MAGTVTLYATASDREEARRLVSLLLERRLIACANLLPMESLYTWEGAVQDEPEVALVMKTTADAADEATRVFVEAHSYDVPCCVVLPHDGGHPPYLDWVADEVG